MNFFARVLSLLYSFYDFLFGKRWYIIEGNIGCGKTTLIRSLKEDPTLEVIEEPVELWKTIIDEEGQNILGLFYANPKKYAYLFQTIVFKSRMMALEHPQEKLIRFSERSIWTDQHIFSKSCYEMKNMNSVEKSTYDLWFDWLNKKISRKPDGIIYLHAKPEVCLARVQERDRAEESSVSLDYLTVIHTKHEEWLGYNTTHEGTPIYIIDNSQDANVALSQVRNITKYDSKYYKIRNRVEACANCLVAWVAEKLGKLQTT